MISSRQMLWAAVVFVSMTCCMGSAQGASPTLTLGVGGHRIKAEIAATPEEWRTGLMHRSSLPADQGMLFVFTEARRHCMWMRNTHLPLSVAFLDDKGTIVNIEDMQPDTEDYHCAARPVRFALEMAAGWFKKRGLTAGMRIHGLERASTAAGHKDN